MARAMGKAAPKIGGVDGPGRGDEPARHLRRDGGACAQRPARLDRRRGRRAGSRAACRPASFPSADTYVDDMAKAASKGKKLDGRGAKDMPAMMNARPGSGVVTNNVANGMLKDPGAVQGVHRLVGQLQLLLHRRAALGPGDGQGAVLRAHGHQPVGDDAVRRHRAAVDVQLGRGLVDRHQHGQRLRLRVDPAGRGQAAVGRQAGRDRGRVAAGREAQGQGLPEPLRLLLARSSRIPRPASCRPTSASSPRSRPRSPARRCGCRRSRSRATRRSPAGPSSARRASSAARSTRCKKGWGGKFNTADQEVRVLQRDAEEGPRRARQEVQHDGRRHPDASAATSRAANWPSCRTTSRPSGTAASASTRSTFIDYKSPPEPRGPLGQPALVPGVQEGRSGRRVVGRRAEDEPGRRPRSWA
ncbi:MAG: hypothetical protein MZW92_28945 [Comamonadaceae bacterium]|nr:hypothetical protein [Comamonadaceae bacterium]